MRKKSIFWLTLICPLFCLILGCQKQLPEEEKFKIILVTDVAGLGDKGFNDAGWAGVQRAVEEFGIEGSFLQSYEQADYIPNLSLAAEEAEVVVAMGFLMVDAMNKVAPHYPDKHFVFIDGSIPHPNVASFDFKAEEGAYLAGIVAAMTTKSGILGVVEGMDIPPVKAYETGFRAGVMTVNRLAMRKVDVLTVVVGDFNNPSKGKSLTQTLLGRGADIIFQLAGNTGLGVLEAVKEAKGEIYAIGVDIDQDPLIPGRVLTSVLKRIDIAVYNVIKDVYQGSFKGGHYWIGLAEGASDLTPMVYTRDKIPPQALQWVEEARQKIVRGELTVPATEEELKKFSPPEF